MPESRIDPVASRQPVLFSPVVWRSTAFGFVAAVFSTAGFLWDRASNAQLPVEWIAFGMACLLILAAVPWRPLAALGAAIVLEYAPARYNSDWLSLLRDHHVIEFFFTLTVVGWLLWLLRGGWRPPTARLLMTVALAFFVWLAISEAVALGSGAIWFPTPGRHNPVLFPLGLVLFLIAAQELQEPTNGWKFALLLTALVTIRIAVSGKEGIYLDEDIATLCVLTIPLALLGASLAPNFFLRMVFGTAIATMLAALVLAQNRTAVTAFVVMALVLIWRSRARWKVTVAASVIVVLGLGAAAAGGYLNRFIVLWDSQAKYATTAPSWSTIESRLNYWRLAYLVTRDNPIFGVGLGNYVIERERYRTKGWVSREGSHNAYLSIAAETGVIGLALYVALFGAGLVAAGRTARTTSRKGIIPPAGYLQASVAGFLVVGLLINRQDMVLSYLLLGWVAALATESAGSLSVTATSQDGSSAPEAEHSA